MNGADKGLLEADGWTVDCESPFELSRKDGSKATGAAAWLILAILKRRPTRFSGGVRVVKVIGLAA